MSRQLSKRTIYNLLIVLILFIFSILLYTSPTIVYLNGKPFQTSLFEKHFNYVVIVQLSCLMLLFLDNMFTKKEIINGIVIENTSPILMYSIVGLLSLSGVAFLGYVVKTYDIEQITKTMFGLVVILIFIYIFIADRERVKNGKESLILTEFTKPIVLTNRIAMVGVNLLENVSNGTTTLFKDGYTYMLSDNKKPKEKVINEEPSYRQTRQESYRQPNSYRQTRPEPKRDQDPLEKYDVEGIYAKVLEFAKDSGFEKIDGSNIEILSNAVGVPTEILLAILQRKYK